MDPKTDAEWQEAVTAAQGALMFDSARKYGLVTGGPEVDVERCDVILRRGRMRGVEPAEDAAAQFVAAHCR